MIRAGDLNRQFLKIIRCFDFLMFQKAGTYSNKNKTLWFWMSGLLLLGAITISLIKFGDYYLQFIAIIAVAGGGILFRALGIRHSFHVVLLSLPLSINLPITGNHQLMFPSELLIAAFGLSVVLYWLQHPDQFSEWFKLPMTVAVCGYIFFMTVSVMFSEMPAVSVKSAIVKILYIISFYGGGYIYFRNNKYDGQYVWYYLVPLLSVISYVLFYHSGFSFSKDVSGYVTKPFFQDHTIYSAAIAFFLPPVISMAVTTPGFRKIGYIIISVVLILALLIAASRAAWLSVIVAFIFGLLLVVKFPKMGFVLLFIFSSILIYVKSDDIIWQLKSNRFDSSARNAGIEEQTKSVTNITNDQSNAERINRWKCALLMFMEKPLTGFGPGTFQFSYFPFQRDRDMTRISVKTPYNIEAGRGGTAHNEFLLILSESGLFAAMFFVLVVIMTVSIGISACYAFQFNYKIFALLLSFITFVVHSLFNNFLDTDKTAILFYSVIAFFAANHFLKSHQHGYER